MYMGHFEAQKEADVFTQTLDSPLDRMYVPDR